MNERNEHNEMNNIPYTNNNYNKLYNKENNKIYIACDKNCPVCKIWKKPNNIWRFLEYFPYHCINCYHAGYNEDFTIIADRAIVCLECEKKYIKAINSVLRKGRRVI